VRDITPFSSVMQYDFNAAQDGVNAEIMARIQQELEAQIMSGMGFAEPEPTQPFGRKRFRIIPEE
jgi:hypothetical protein